MQSARNQYLQAMGIQVWHLREPLTGAKANVPVDLTSDAAFDENELQSLASSLSAQTQDQLSARVQQAASASETSNAISETMEKPADPQPPAPSATTAVIDQSVDTDIESNPVFRMASIIYPGCCLVVTEVPAQGVEPLVDKQLVLIKNLLLSLGCNVSEQAIITLFNWPMLRTAGFDQSANAAREACQAFLRGQKSKHTVPFVLLMGQQTGRYMLSQSNLFEATKGQLILPSEQPVLLSYSIQQLYDEPKLKSQLWQDVQPLHNWLQRD